MNKTFFCPNCGKNIDLESTMFCPECGTNLKPYIDINNSEKNNYKNVIQSTNSKIESGKKKCNCCGNVVFDYVEKCPNCGCIFPKQTSIDSSKNKINNPDKSYPMIIAGQVLTAISFILINPLMILSILGLVFSCIGYSQAKGDNNDKQAKKAIGTIIVAIIACVWFVIQAYTNLNKLGIQVKLF